MTSVFDQTRKSMLEEVRRKRNIVLRETSNNQAKALGLFLDECLKNRGMSRQTFAESLEMEPELADAILDGALPDSELNNDLLAEIAEVISYDPPILHLMMGRSSKGNNWRANASV